MWCGTTIAQLVPPHFLLLVNLFLFRNLGFFSCHVVGYQPEAAWLQEPGVKFKNILIIPLNFAWVFQACTVKQYWVLIYVTLVDFHIENVDFREQDWGGIWERGRDQTISFAQLFFGVASFSHPLLLDPADEHQGGTGQCYRIGMTSNDKSTWWSQRLPSLISVQSSS